jgi:[acyl-carrier-protein] S-malonyltransferase
MSESAAATVILFPGQGVGDPSDREFVAGVRPDLLELAIELVGDDPFERIGDGTRFSQPAVYCASIAGFERLGRPRAGCFAGHSLGEIGALAAGGALEDEDGLRAVVARGSAMDEAARAAPRGGMLAVGADRDGAEALVASHDLTLANENSPRQYILSGREDPIESAQREARELGIRVKRLAVVSAFHTEAMAAAVEPFRAALDRIDFRHPVSPVISSGTAAPFDPDPRDALASALVSPVRWIEVMRRVHELGITRYVDVGPGKVLAGLARRTLDGVEIETAAGLEATVA